MAAPSNYYVDPASGTDDTVGDRGVVTNPWKSVQFALDNVTRDATNGDRINIKAGTADTLSSKLVTTTYGTPTATAPIMFQGYTSVTGDAGIGDIDGGGSSIFNETNQNGVHFIDMHLHNCGGNQVVRANDDCILENCEVDTTTHTSLSAVQYDLRSIMIGNHVHDFTATGLRLSDGLIGWNYVVHSHATNANPAILMVLEGTIQGNIIELTASGSKAEGIRLNSNGSKAIGNSVWANAGDNLGIVSFNTFGACIVNNLVEGFSATGGVGIQTGTSASTYVLHNAVFDCATAYNFQNDIFIRDLDNESLSVTPFTDQAGGNYKPVDTGNVKDGAYIVGAFRGLSTTSHFRYKGAVQPGAAAAASGGGSRYRGLVPGGGLGAS